MLNRFSFVAFAALSAAACRSAAPVATANDDHGCRPWAEIEHIGGERVRVRAYHTTGTFAAQVASHAAVRCMHHAVREEHPCQIGPKAATCASCICQEHDDAFVAYENTATVIECHPRGIP